MNPQEEEEFEFENSRASKESGSSTSSNSTEASSQAIKSEQDVSNCLFPFNLLYIGYETFSDGSFTSFDRS